MRAVFDSCLPRDQSSSAWRLRGVGGGVRRLKDGSNFDYAGDG